MVSPSGSEATEATPQAKDHSASGLACVDAGTCTALTGYTPLFAIFAPSPEKNPDWPPGHCQLLVDACKERIAPILEFMDNPRALLEAQILRLLMSDPKEWGPVIRNTVKPSWFTSPMNWHAYRALVTSQDYGEWRRRVLELYSVVRLERMENVYLGSWDDLCLPDEEAALQLLWEMAERGKRVEELDLGSLQHIRR